ncbi:hypothetical protein EW145_g3412 [Phellinidium pouzarii]|uniref:Uncharacterized protein n=1 Tax=Phellinidium pouzarii TaxID=167371 RepID=A0A4S4L777_9AGAM|nr:hypothetical protein EW145_g3412 [Phellinidium pouzarii]
MSAFMEGVVTTVFDPNKAHGDPSTFPIMQALKNTPRPAPFPSSSRRPISDSVERRLNCDVLREIFMWCTAEFPTTNLMALTPSRCFPDNVASVCSRWRDVALSTPQIWSNIDTRHRDGPQEAGITQENPFPWNQVLKRLSLSGKVPLTLKFLSEKDDWDHFADTINLVEGLQERCRSISVAYTHGTRMILSRPLPSSLVDLHNMPLLEELDLCIPSLEEWNEPAFLVDLSSAICLKSLRITICDSRFSLFSDGTPLTQLTSIVLCTPFHEALIDVDACMQLLEIAPALEHFAAEVGEIADNTFSPETTRNTDIRLERLTHFSLCYHQKPFLLQYILQRITLPRLEELKIGMGDEGDEEEDVDIHQGTPTGITSFVKRSSTHLTKLHLSSVDITEIFHTLAVSPNLTSLELDNVCADGVYGERELVLALAIQHGRRVLCPMLETLVFSYCKLGSCVTEAAYLVASRWNLPAGLRRLAGVAFVGCDDVSLIVAHTAVVLCIAQGLRVTVES